MFFEQTFGVLSLAYVVHGMVLPPLQRETCTGMELDGLHPILIVFQVELWLQHRDARRVELQTDGKARSASGLSDAVSSTTSEMAVVWD